MLKVTTLRELWILTGIDAVHYLGGFHYKTFKNPVKVGAFETLEEYDACVLGLNVLAKTTRIKLAFLDRKAFKELMRNLERDTNGT